MKRKRNNYENHPAQALAWQRNKTEVGLCPRCGAEKRDFNKKTSAPYKYGPVCRGKVREEQKWLMRERRMKNAK